jgi:hypothetical protein
LEVARAPLARRHRPGRPAGKPSVGHRRAGRRLPAGPATLEARLETPPLFDDEADGGADGDDPAIWAHPSRPGRSLVVVTK